MRARRFLTGVAAGFVAVLLPTVTAQAGEHPSRRGWVDRDEGEIEVGAEGGTWSVGLKGDASSTAAGTGGVPVCEWERVPADHPIYQRWASQYDEPVLYFKLCPGEPLEVIEVPPGSDPPASAPDVARQRAVERLALPVPDVELNPSEPVVHVETWLWVEGLEWRSVSETATAGAVSATVMATPRRVTWDMGNGDWVVCEGPGTAYDPSKSSDAQSTDCSYTYRTSSAGEPGDVYRVTATVEWELRWTVTGAAGGGALPAMTTSESIFVPVSEMQALNQ